MPAATATSLELLETTLAAPPDCPIGSLTIRTDGRTITAVSFACGGTARPAARDASDHPLLRRAATQLREYFAGERTSFDLPLGARGTQWQESVWRALREIPYGTTATYGDVARSAGNAKAARAVGAANHVNPLGIVVPCHRVIGSDGSLIGYAGGLDAKSWLLLHERRVRPAGR